MSDGLRLKFPDLEPVASPPWLFSVNGIGLLLYGRRDVDPETGTYVKTRSLCLLFLPLLVLDSWRVADATGGGWMVLGRCSISSLARLWNILVLAAVLVGGGSLGWNAYQESPGYQAGRRLAEAQRAEANGELTAAANAYRQVAEGGTTRAPAAAAALAALAQGPLAQAPLAVQARVVAQLAALPPAARAAGSEPAEMAALALRLAAAAPAGSEPAAMAVLDAAALVAEPGGFADQRQRLFAAAHARDAGDPWAATGLALAAEATGDRGRCQALLEPCLARLGDSEGARILGRIYAGLGRTAESQRLLRPYVDARLGELRTAATGLEKAHEAAVQAAFAQLNSQGADPAWYRAYADADKAGKERMAQEWVAARLRTDPAIAAAQRRLGAAAPVVSVALDFGIACIQQAQGFADPAQREAMLREAEQVFLAIRSVAGETDAYRLWMAQVDYWLGKPAEGRALLDELLATRQRAPQSLLAVAGVLREVGDHGTARVICEEAYAATSGDPALHDAAARQRSVLFIDLDDRIAWLERCDQSSTYIAAELPAARGLRARREGREQEAVADLERSLAAWNALPRNASTLNNAATVAQSLHAISGDPEHLRTACARLEEAHALMPSNTILLSNLIHARRSLAISGCIAGTIDARALGRALDARMFDHCHRDSTGRQQLVSRYQADPGRRLALADADRLLLMSPREGAHYELVAGELALARDATALAALDARVAAADLDHAANWARLREWLAGKRDAQMVAESAADIRRLEQRVAALRGAGKDPTLALALDLLAAERLGLAALAQPVDHDACLALAEEAMRLHPCRGSVTQLVFALESRAAARLARRDPALAQITADQRRLLNPVQVLLLLARDGRWRAELAVDADLRQAAGLAAAAMAADPELTNLWDGLLLAAVGDAGTEAAAGRLRGDPLLPLLTRIDLHLDPASALNAVEVALVHRLQGESVQAEAVLDAARRQGLALAPGL
jgi:hypothetical protein